MDEYEVDPTARALCIWLESQRLSTEAKIEHAMEYDDMNGMSDTEWNMLDAATLAGNPAMSWQKRVFWLYQYFDLMEAHRDEVLDAALEKMSPENRIIFLNEIMERRAAAGDDSER
jgi:hypothetical protein